MFEATEGRSVLLITHRPEGLDRVDEIATLVDGRIVSRTAAPSRPGTDAAPRQTP